MCLSLQTLHTEWQNKLSAQASDRNSYKNDVLWLMWLKFGYVNKFRSMFKRKQSRLSVKKLEQTTLQLS